MIVGLGRGGGLGCGGLRCRGCVRGFRRVGGARHSSVGIFHHLSRNRAADGIAVEFQRSEDEFDVRFVGFARGYGARDCAGEVRGAAFARLTYAWIHISLCRNEVRWEPTHISYNCSRRLCSQSSPANTGGDSAATSRDAQQHPARRPARTTAMSL